MTVDWKKKLIPNLPYLLFVYLFDKLCQAVRLAPGLDASEKFLHLSQGFTEAFSSGLPSLHPLDLLAGIAGAVIVRLAVYAKSKNTKKYRKGIEYGSARWGTAADIAPYDIYWGPRKGDAFVGRGGAAERVSFRTCAEAKDAQLATTRQKRR